MFNVLAYEGVEPIEKQRAAKADCIRREKEQARQRALLTKQARAVYREHGKSIKPPLRVLCACRTCKRCKKREYMRRMRRLRGSPLWRRSVRAACKFQYHARDSWDALRDRGMLMPAGRPEPHQRNGDPPQAGSAVSYGYC